MCPCLTTLLFVNTCFDLIRSSSLQTWMCFSFSYPSPSPSPCVLFFFLFFFLLPHPPSSHAQDVSFSLLFSFSSSFLSLPFFIHLFLFSSLLLPDRTGITVRRCGNPTLFTSSYSLPLKTPQKNPYSYSFFLRALQLCGKGRVLCAGRLTEYITCIYRP